MKPHSAKAIAISQPLLWADAENTRQLTPDELLAYCARVSSTANQNNHETGPKLLASLVRRKEWSPLEMVSITMEIYTSRAIARQILRHRSFSFQEFSQRYAKVADEPIFSDARGKHPTDRQMSVKIEDEEVQREWRETQLGVWRIAMANYETALAGGLAKEVARNLLPEGMTPSRLYMAGTVRSWLHYFDLRCDPKTQWEHQCVAKSARRELSTLLPSLLETIFPLQTLEPTA